MRRRVLALLLASTATTIACGGGQAATTAAHPAPSTSGSAPAQPTATAAPFAQASVPMQPMPPPFQFGSKKADKKALPGVAGCSAAWRPQSNNLGAEVTKLGTACAAQTKMHAVGAALTGTSNQGAPAQSFKLKAEANRCYRVYAALAPTIKSAELLVVDSAGAVAAQAHTDEPRAVAAEDGAVCFKAADDAQVLVSVGTGEGAYAVQIWSD